MCCRTAQLLEQRNGLASILRSKSSAATAAVCMRRAHARARHRRGRSPIASISCKTCGRRSRPNSAAPTDQRAEPCCRHPKTKTKARRQQYIARRVDAKSRNIDALPSRRIVARGKPSLIKSGLYATLASQSATSLEKPGLVRSIRKWLKFSASGAPRHGAEAFLAQLFPGVSIAPLGGRPRTRTRAAPRDQTPRLHRQLLPSGAASGEVANCNGRQSRQSCHPRSSASGSHACDGDHNCDADPRCRSSDGLADPIVAASLCIKPRGLLTPGQARKIDALKSSSPDFTSMRQLAMRFRGILRSKDIQKFDVWLNDAQQSGIYAIHRFARTIRRDIDAVRNALTEGWTNGQTEGQINRLKTLKRAMYGRAGPKLLRARMLPLHLPIDHRV